MRQSKNVLSVILSLLVLCACSLFLMPGASAAEYKDGVYTADVSTVGEGWHNSVVSPTTVYIEDGAVYVDIVFVRTTSPWHAPAYVSLTTDYGTYYDPAISEENYTCAFYHVRVDSLGEIPFSAVTEAMSMPYSVDYAVYIDPDAVPLKSEEAPAPSDDPEPSDEPAPGEDPEPADEPSPAEQPEPDKEDGAKPDGPDKAPDKEEPEEAGHAENSEPADPEKADTVPGKDESEEDGQPVPTTGPDSDQADASTDDTVPEGTAKDGPALGTGAIIGIVCAAAVVIAAVVIAISRKK